MTEGVNPADRPGLPGDDDGRSAATAAALPGELGPVIATFVATCEAMLADGDRVRLADRVATGELPATTPGIECRRALVAADRAVRVWAPVALRAAHRLGEGRRLAGLRPLTDEAAARRAAELAGEAASAARSATTVTEAYAALTDSPLAAAEAGTFAVAARTVQAAANAAFAAAVRAPARAGEAAACAAVALSCLHRHETADEVLETVDDLVTITFR